MRKILPGWARECAPGGGVPRDRPNEMGALFGWWGRPPAEALEKARRRCKQDTTALAMCRKVYGDSAATKCAQLRNQALHCHAQIHCEEVRVRARAWRWRRPPTGDRRRPNGGSRDPQPPLLSLTLTREALSQAASEYSRCFHAAVAKGVYADAACEAQIRAMVRCLRRSDGRTLKHDLAT